MITRSASPIALLVAVSVALAPLVATPAMAARWSARATPGRTTSATTTSATTTRSGLTGRGVGMSKAGFQRAPSPSVAQRAATLRDVRAKLVRRNATKNIFEREILDHPAMAVPLVLAFFGGALVHTVGELPITGYLIMSGAIALAGIVPFATDLGRWLRARTAAKLAGVKRELRALEAGERY